ncbi:hypothetical protein HBH98_021440 [Parastagonospora nodorum]|nr:hypothetical protein HBH53_079490 [Parastagonospora nodorum]KAH4005529.1 hypothetical protein HBI10_033340 [Parastagonospora nodorum]KAH4033071.1 hypothetical protein HBI13_005760 [Parastagonospora nodorum]KAH4060954.1 hypothetical protein HBH49_008770 [Parastagonospora nodorum]KAH4352470.1 hypothetical protein HBH98_021440 [Parastagonospora nodorum]
MILPRLLSLSLRATQFLTSTIVLALAATILSTRHTYPSEDALFARLIYILIIAALSLVLSLPWILPTTNAIVHWGADLLLAAAWFAVFGILQGWFSGWLRCGGGWADMWRWGPGNKCGMWDAAQAFSFLAAVAWFVSFILGLLVWAKRDKGVVAGQAGAGTAGRRQWFKRSKV